MQEQTPYPCTFLIGLHGVGKTTLGRHMSSEHGWLHLSMGDLARLARSRRMPREHSVRFMGHLATQAPGERLNMPLIEALLGEIEHHRKTRCISVDGFPCEPFHVGLLPSGSRLVHLSVPEEVRMSRLEHRGTISVRQWKPQAVSATRDLDLSVLLDQHSPSIIQLDANMSTTDLAAQLLQKVNG